MAIDITPTTILAPFEAEHQAVNLTRNNKGSAWDRIGNNQLIDADQWRYNYNPDTGIFEGRTIMGQWTNEIQDPRDMTTGNWGKGEDTVVVTRDQVGIDGEANTACLLNDDGGNKFINQEITVADNNNYATFIIFVEKDSDESRFPLFFAEFKGGTTEVRQDLWINTSTGAKDEGSNTGGSTEVKDRGDWWELVITIQNNSTGNTTTIYNFYPAGGTTIGSVDLSATGTATVDAAQVFLNRSSPPPTPVYGETAGQSYTQHPDIATITDLDAINFNPDEGTFVVEAMVPYEPSSREVLLEIGVPNIGTNYADITAEMGNDINLRGNIDGSGTGGLSLGSFTEGEKFKVSFTFGSSGYAGNVDGMSVATDTEDFTQVSFGELNIGNGTQGQSNSFIKSIKYYPRRLSNDDLIQETTL